MFRLIISVVQKRESDTERSANLPRVTQHTRVVAPGLKLDVLVPDTSKHSFTWLKRRQTFNQRKHAFASVNKQFQEELTRIILGSRNGDKVSTPPNTLPVRHLQDKGKREVFFYHRYFLCYSHQLYKSLEVLLQITLTPRHFDGMAFM